MVDENEEEDETDQSGHEGQEAEEEALRGPDAVRLRVGRHLAAGHAHAVVVLTVVPEVTRSWEVIIKATIMFEIASETG